MVEPTIYTTRSREFAARFAAKLNLTQPNSDFSMHEIEEVAPGHWRVARVYHRSDNNQHDRESVPLPDDEIADYDEAARLERYEAARDS